MKNIFKKIFKNKYKNEEKKYTDFILPKIQNYRNIIASKETISFLHYGHLGDIINSLPVIKEISKFKKCSLYIEVNKKINDPRAITNNPGNDIFLSKNLPKIFGKHRLFYSFDGKSRIYIIK